MFEIACLYPNALGSELPALRRCRELGYEAVQLHPRAFVEPEALSEEIALEPVLSAARSASVRIAAWGGYQPLIGEAEAVARHVAYLSAVLRLAGRAARQDSELSTPIVCTETGAPDPERSPDDEWAQLVASLSTLAAVAEEVGAHLAIEPTRRHIIRDALTAQRVLRDVGSPALGICYDPANIVRPGEPLRESFDALAPHILISHAKDVHFAEDGSVESYPPAGEGDLAYEEFAELLAQLPHLHTLAVEYARSEEQLERVARRELRG